MKQNNFAYLFAVALAAGTVGMTSCSSEAGDIADAGVENKVTLSLSVADRVSGRATADQVNLGSTMQEIKNIAAVPMVGDVYQTPIILGNFTPADQNKTTTKVVALNSNVNKFKVYGNIENVSREGETGAVAAFDESKIFKNFTISVPEVSAENKPNSETNTYYQPHGLYYYAFAGEGNNKIQTGSSSTDLKEVDAGTAIGKDTKYIKLSNVHYAVGVLATAVFNASEENVIISNGQTEANAVVSDENVKFKGIIINKQSKTLNQDFVQSGTELVSIYDASLNTASGEQEPKQGFDGTKFQPKNESQKFTNISQSANNQDKANIYTIVAATGSSSNKQITEEDDIKAVIGEIITGNLEFELQQGYKLKLSNSTTIDATDAAKKFYMAFRLQPERKENNPDGSYSYRAVFMKDHMTFFNAKVKNWGLASETPIDITDATIGVEVDLSWNEGIVYDEEI